MISNKMTIDMLVNTVLIFSHLICVLLMLVKFYAEKCLKARVCVLLTGEYTGAAFGLHPVKLIPS